MPDQEGVVIMGVDTHKDNHVAAIIDEVGGVLGTQSFPATASGYCRLFAWAQTFGHVSRAGVEGTGSYGAGLARHLGGQKVQVVEVNRPNRQMRRLQGKSDAVDAITAARSALNGEATAQPKRHDGVVESIRTLRVVFCSFRDTRTRISNQIHGLIVTAPDALRLQLKPLSLEKCVDHCARFRPGDLLDSAQGIRCALRALSRQYQELTNQMDELKSSLDALVVKANPALMSARGVGVDVASIVLVAVGDDPGRLKSEAALAALAGVSPVDASSGKVVRRRLNQGGDRQLNHALWRIVMVRITCDAATKAYVKRRTEEGKSRREIVRCLKRYVVREIFQLLTNPPVVPVGSDLRSARLDAGITLATVAKQFQTQQIHVSRIERGLSHDSDFANRYQEWLKNPVCAA